MIWFLNRSDSFRLFGNPDKYAPYRRPDDVPQHAIKTFDKTLNLPSWYYNSHYEPERNIRDRYFIIILIHNYHIGLMATIYTCSDLSPPSITIITCISMIRASSVTHSASPPRHCPTEVVKTWHPRPPPLKRYEPWLNPYDTFMMLTIIL